MGTTTFTGPVKAGGILNTSGSTVGTDIANVGYVVMAQTAVIDIAGATATTTIGYVPAGSKILYAVLNATTANDDGTASTCAIGTAAATTAFLAATSVQSAGVSFSAEMTAASTDVGTTDVQVVATFTATDGDGTAGVADATIVYLQAVNLV